MKYIFSIVALAIALTAGAETKANGYYKGDINGDGNVTINDIALLVNVLKEGTTPTAPSPCNVDGDTDVDLDDLSALVNIVLGKAEKVWVNVDSIPSGGGTTSGGIKEAEAKGSIIEN